jgi:hypothetical protein
LREAIGETLRLMRNNKSERCVACGVGVGIQHADNCPAWPVIRARSNYALFSGPDLFGGPEDG